MLSAGITTVTTQEYQKNGIKKTEKPEEKPQTQRQYEWNLVWRNIILYTIMHVAGAYGLYKVISLNTNWKTVLWCYALMVMGLQGITSGVHRLWTHRSYKAKLPLRILLCIFNTIALQTNIYVWVRDHRVHHKFADTDADPHNSKRGLFFSHVGWLFVEQTKEAIEKTAAVDMSDIHQDGVVMFQKKYYIPLLAPVIGLFLPAYIPYRLWGEDFSTAFFVASMMRYALTTNITFLVNSFAHKYGTRPYDKNIASTDTLPVSMLTGGEGWHNYHHTFPWDYKAGELGYRTNWSTAFIDFMAKIGWAYDLKSVSAEMLEKRIRRTGDGTIIFEDNQEKEIDNKEEPVLWGWGDSDMTEKDYELVDIRNKLD